MGLDPVRRLGEFVFVVGGDDVPAEATGRADEAIAVLRGVQW